MLEKCCKIEDVGFSIILNQNDRLNTSSNLSRSKTRRFASGTFVGKFENQ